MAGSVTGFGWKRAFLRQIHNHYYNCKKCLERTRKASNKGRYAENRKRYKDDLRKAAFGAYGNKCSCCPEHRISMLEFDHVGGWGKEHIGSTGVRISNTALFIWLRNNDYPSTIRLLCGSCHTSITRNGVCEHETEALKFILENCRSAEPSTAPQAAQDPSFDSARTSNPDSSRSCIPSLPLSAS